MQVFLIDVKIKLNIKQKEITIYGSGPDAMAYELVKNSRSGRPNKLNKVLIEEICDLIAEGYPFAEAARMRRISESSFFSWMAMGRKENAEPIYKELVAKVEEASEFSESELIQAMRSSAIRDRNWRSAAWMLERRFPEKYGRQRLKVESEN